MVQRGLGLLLPGRAAAPPSPLAVQNVTAHPSTASVPITVLLYDGPLLCGFNVAIKGLHCKITRISPVGPDAVQLRVISQINATSDDC